MRLFDLHCDTVYELYHSGETLLRNRLHIDLERASRYLPWSQVFAVWIPDEWRGPRAINGCDAMLRLAKQQFAVHADRVALVQNGIQMHGALSSGKGAAWLSVEGGAALGGQIGRVQTLFERGVRMMTLTWNGENELGHGCLSPCRDGLTAFGKAVVDEMTRVGMWIDVSHLNAHGFDDVANRTVTPFLATHSVSNTVFSHPRNLTDDQFAVIRDRGGLVGLNLCASQLGTADFYALQRHLDYFLSLGGEMTVAFGCDFDGTALPHEWNGIAVMEQIGEFLTKKHYSADLIDRLFFKNAYDFFTRFDTDQKV